jgi:uncharacterized protein (DUF736 family)
MTILGRFEEADGGYAGTVRTLSLQAHLTFEPLKGDTDRAPSHRVLCEGVECGTAWTSDDESGLLNVRLDDPSWPEPIRARLVRGREDALLLVWRRPPPA